MSISLSGDDVRDIKLLLQQYNLSLLLCCVHWWLSGIVINKWLLNQIKIQSRRLLDGSL